MKPMSNLLEDSYTCESTSSPVTCSITNNILTITSLDPDSTWNLAYTNDESISTIQITGSISKIPDNSFKNWIHITTLTVTSTLSEIGLNAFSGCTSLQTIQLPNTVTTISQQSFENCKSLTIVYLMDVKL